MRSPVSSLISNSLLAISVSCAHHRLSRAIIQAIALLKFVIFWANHGRNAYSQMLKGNGIIEDNAHKDIQMQTQSQALSL
ncbi:hypothetical protein RHMOL_Rhmol03G0016900 [Rhododendron molle]|uniref:Uncharacterized protein n=1 Tax=Rhododendron molle TaxID=49168 RepID=A0ACC0PAZ3_RHOML|nr:hypothetical protein RHMOL_Rhmol03G0016900 [Rhododendron molle]